MDILKYTVPKSEEPKKVKLEVKGLSKIYGINSKNFLKTLPPDYDKGKVLSETGYTIALYNACFEVYEGEMFVIIGLSGSGKSTLIRCLNLLNRPTAGQILLDGNDVIKYDKKKLLKYRRDVISMVFQNFGLLSHRNVLDNVAFGLEIKGTSKAERYSKALKTLELVGLGGWESYPIDSLSGGMKQRVGLARALANDPEIMLMDEPFSALDPIVRRDMQFELLRIHKKLKKTTIFITHDINEAFKLGDRVAIMKDGRIMRIGTPEEILSDPGDEYTERFIMDIDRSKVLNASNAMEVPTALVDVRDGPNIALKAMKNAGLSSAFVVDENMILVGLITLDEAMKAKKTHKSIADAMLTDLVTTSPTKSLHELIPIATSVRYPISVVDNDGRLLGVLTRVAVLSSLTSNNSYNEQPEKQEVKKKTQQQENSEN
jgi:glycine betaine/proline transport system ATP-binding protein